jgi:hypothetical protein
MRGDWMNPSDEQNPDNGTHQAALPNNEDPKESLTANKKRRRFRLFRKPINPESYQE